MDLETLTDPFRGPGKRGETGLMGDDSPENIEPTQIMSVLNFNFYARVKFSIKNVKSRNGKFF